MSTPYKPLRKLKTHRFVSLVLRKIAEAMVKAGQMERAVEVTETVGDLVARLQAHKAIIVAEQRGGKKVKRGKIE